MEWPLIIYGIWTAKNKWNTARCITLIPTRCLLLNVRGQQRTSKYQLKQNRHFFYWLEFDPDLSQYNLLHHDGTLASTRVNPRVFGGVRIAHLFSFLCCPIMCLYVLSFVLWYSYIFCIKTMFGSSLPPVVCRRAHVLFTLFVFICVYWC